MSYNHASTDGFNTSLRDVALQDDDGYSNKTIHARVGINLSDSLRLDAVARNTESDNEYDDCGGALKDVCTGTFDQEVRRVALSHSLDWLDNSIAYSSSEVDRDNFTAGVSSYATEGEIEKLEWNGRVRFNDAHALAYGLEDRTDRVLDNERDQDAGFLEYQGRYGDSIFITAGARQDDNEDFGKFETYRVSGAYVVGVESGDVKFKTSYGTGFRAPSLYEIDYNRQQNDPTLPQLAPEESTGVDVGVEYFANNGLYLEAVLFKQTVENELGWVSDYDSPFWGYYGQGTGESKSQGVELSLATPLTEQLHLNANYTYVDAETVTGLPRARVPEHLANLGLSYEPNDAWQFAVNVRASAGAKETNGKKLDDYQLLDASVRYIASPMLSFHLRGENLTNKDYVEVANYRTAKSAIYGGVKIDF